MSSDIPLVDLHCHLDLYEDFEELASESDALGIYTLAVTTTPRAWPRNRDVAATRRFVRPALGFHPQLAATHSAELRIWERFFPQARYIGEVGLDGGPAYRDSLELQGRIFQAILNLCNDAGDKIISVHSARAASEVLALLEKALTCSRNSVVLHWFTGTRAEAHRALRLGCFFSINNQMLRSRVHRELIAGLPLDRLLTETDGPFIRTGSRPSRPKDVRLVLEELAKLHHTEVGAMALIIRDNLRALTTGGRPT
jgi:TatD DNase family protein